MDFLFGVVAVVDVGVVVVDGGVAVNKRGHKLERTPKLMEPQWKQFSFQQIEFWNFLKRASPPPDRRGGEDLGKGGAWLCVADM